MKLLPPAPPEIEFAYTASKRLGDFVDGFVIFRDLIALNLMTSARRAYLRCWAGYCIAGKPYGDTMNGMTQWLRQIAA
jgi:hypothetical protein